MEHDDDDDDEEEEEDDEEEQSRRDIEDKRSRERSNKKKSKGQGQVSRHPLVFRLVPDRGSVNRSRSRMRRTLAARLRIRPVKWNALSR